MSSADDIDGALREAVTRSRRGLAQVSLRAVIVVACPRSEGLPARRSRNRSAPRPVRWFRLPDPDTEYGTGPDRCAAVAPTPSPRVVRRRRAGGLPWRATAVDTVLRRTPVGPSRVRPSPAPSSALRWPRLPSPRRTPGPSGTSSRSARAPATGRSTRATASAAACSSPRARGARSAARAWPIRRPARSRSSWPSGCSPSRAGAPGPPARASWASVAPPRRSSSPPRRRPQATPKKVTSTAGGGKTVTVAVGRHPRQDRRGQRASTCWQQLHARNGPRNPNVLAVGQIIDWPELTSRDRARSSV